MVTVLPNSSLQDYRSTPVESATEALNLRRLLPMMTRRQSWTYWALVGVWALAVAVFWVWWLQTEHWVTPAGMLINSVMLVWTTLLPAWFFFFAGRMSRPNPALTPAGARVAIIVTKAPAEPWAVVRATLEGMLRQDYPEPYDVWLADEAPAPATLAWCAEHGVQVSSRQGVVAYHRATWPRRTKCKEGNLAYFYDHWGYRDYDIVAQLDADHVPAPGYLRAMVAPFANPAVGYVAAPSVCDANRGESWAVRGRLYAEAPFHGAMQAGNNGGFAPACIGSHYAVRTAALRQVGGLGPELAEDFTTTLLLTAGGWEGVFAIDAEAHGDGPAGFADYIVQEFQWSRSLTNVLLRVVHRSWGRLTPRQQVKLGFGLIWYPLYALYMLVAFLFPIIALLTGTPWVSVPLLEFFLFAGAPGVAALAIVWRLRRGGWLRPAAAPLWSWELVLFQFTRWPWVLWGVAQAFAGWLLRTEFAFKVTPKGETGARPLPLTTLLPYLAVALVSAGTTLVVGDPGAARGYVFFCLLNAVTHLGVALAVLVLHLRENRDRLRLPVWRVAGAHVAAMVATALPVGLALARGGEHLVGIVDVAGLLAVAWQVGSMASLLAGELIPAGLSHSRGAATVGLLMVLVLWARPWRRLANAWSARAAG